MIISHRHRYIFIKTRKTAGASVELALVQSCGPDDIMTLTPGCITQFVPNVTRVQLVQKRYLSKDPGFSYSRHIA